MVYYEYSKDFVYLKRRNSLLQTFNVRNHKSENAIASHAAAAAPAARKKSVWSLTKALFKEYCNTSSIHCFHYFASTKLKFIEKVIWFFIVVATSVCCIMVYFDLAELYHSQRMQTTVVNSAHPIFTVPFPSVGLCLRNRINFNLLYNEAPKRFLPPNVSNQTLNTFYKFFETMADVKFYTLNKFAPLFDPGAKFNLTLIDGVNILEVMDYLTYSCTEVFKPTCTWRYKAYNCCELFTLERTEFGYCYVFNSVVSNETREKAKNDPFYPYHNSYAGEGSGVEVDVLLDESTIKPEINSINGLHIMIKKSTEWTGEVKFINYNTFTKLSLMAQLTDVDGRVREIPPVDRGCMFEDEVKNKLYKNIPGFTYWRGNCITRCHQEYVVKYCKCNLNTLFPQTQKDSYTSCKPSDFKCIYEHANLFSNETHLFESNYIRNVNNESMVCNCLNSCNVILYQAFYTSFPLERYDTTNDTTKMIHLDIHYQVTYMQKYRTSMRYAFVESIANFGGIIGLFLGASLLSAVELIYYATFGFCMRLYDQLQDQYHHNSPIVAPKPKMQKISVIQLRDIYKR